VVDLRRKTTLQLHLLDRYFCRAFASVPSMLQLLRAGSGQVYACRGRPRCGRTPSHSDRIVAPQRMVVWATIGPKLGAQVRGVTC
jgi:hypothetical protein